MRQVTAHPINTAKRIDFSIKKLISYFSFGVKIPKAALKYFTISKDIYGIMAKPERLATITMNKKNQTIALKTEFLKNIVMPLSSPNTHSLIAANSRAASEVEFLSLISSVKALSLESVKASQRGLSGNLK